VSVYTGIGVCGTRTTLFVISEDDRSSAALTTMCSCVVHQGIAIAEPDGSVSIWVRDLAQLAAMPSSNFSVAFDQFTYNHTSLPVSVSIAALAKTDGKNYAVSNFK
jgi:hypothetical protein